MRAQRILLILLCTLLLMSALLFRCLGCNKECKDARGLKTHERSCQKNTVFTTSTLKKRGREEGLRVGEKVARMENESLVQKDREILRGRRDETEPDEFGSFRCYPTRPTAAPQGPGSLDKLSDAPTLSEQLDGGSTSSALQRFGPGVLKTIQDGAEKARDWFFPFLNVTVFRLMAWANTGSNVKSDKEIQRLVDEVILADDFNREDLRSFRVPREFERLDSMDAPNNVFAATDGWHETSVKIQVPKEGVRFTSEADAPTFTVPNVFFRKLTEVIRSAAQAAKGQDVDFLPFRSYWRRRKMNPERAANGDPGHSDSEPSGLSDDDNSGDRFENIRLFSDLPDTDAMLEEDARIRAMPRNPEDAPEVEYALAPLMVWSDSTHLANFGGANLWPVYIYFGWLSKYLRARPKSFAAHHLAYLPSLPDSIQDWYQTHYRTTATADVLRFCKKELMHAIWCLLMDDEFMNAYHKGMLIHCADGVWRRFFPRFFTYSADYPEKALLACIRFLAQCPCPRCLIKKADILRMGSSSDQQQRQNWRIDGSKLWNIIARVRQWIYRRGYALTSKAITQVLDPMSILPTRSAFSSRLGATGFNFYSLFAPDILHEFELGVWKAIFIHLLRILCAVGNDRIQILNERFRRVPTFGRNTIRRFSRNVSGMKQMAGRDLEDILQCIMPVFETCLPPPHDELVMTLLFKLALWHGLAKLRLHTEETVAIFHAATRSLGKIARQFLHKTCEAYETRELPKEEAARGRPTVVQTVKRKLLNLLTYKWHSLGDCPFAIPWFGCLDGVNTQQGEMEHRQVKRFYVRTNKNQAARQIARRQRREHQLLKMLQRDRERRTAEQAVASAPLAEEARKAPPAASHNQAEADPLPFQTSPHERYHVSRSERHHENIFKWVSEHHNDPAFPSFIPMLKDHLLSRLTDREYDGDEDGFGPDEHDTVRFVNDRIYFHKALRINYTSYDMRRAQDTINPRTQPNIMLLAPTEDDGDDSANQHPYWYARVLGIFHLNVKHRGFLSKSKAARRMDVLWIRWYGRDLTAPGGFETCRLHRVGFIPHDAPNSFGFLDPNQVLRACHIIPAFAYGKTPEYLPPSVARRPEERDEDYVYYYIGMFADRDMLMRFIGGAIGHKGLPSNRVTARIRYPQGELNSALVDELWETSLDHDAAPVTEYSGSADPARAASEAEEGVPSDEEDYGYQWNYDESEDDRNEAADDEPEVEGNLSDGNGAEEERAGEDSPDELGGEDGEEMWEDDFEQEGYASP
ncbi:uncharacterized protein C8Q71DRAFT_797981 [Rhodofomes roseus]|uniref:C2H2-type domain-containing protein n=1 Tax=Rhodofomes roseus TaxID=34475 RepID=A0ABQ8KA29_9APHY|nr:uncharacterized protein C8Q71DRAFT_797981 [Rhodofomes roseus]KAH9834205.1 hypothetical protein C8Q71DRAFT_797981 [Rhodofomes roseus]